MDAYSNEELERVRTTLRGAGCDLVLLSSLANVTYASGFEVPIPLGALSELAYGPTLALCSTSAPESWLIVSAASTAKARKQSRLDQVLAFGAFDSFTAIDSRASFLDTVRAALEQAGLTNRGAVLGVEGRAMPYALTELLQGEFPGLSLVNVDDALQEARLIKTQREIGLLRRAAHIGDEGHMALAEQVRQAGRTEFEMWGDLIARMHHAAGYEIAVSGELVTGARTSVVEYPAGPRVRTTEAGDAALMDISGRVDGYWFDCTNTHVVGGVEPAPHQLKYARASQAACEAAINALRPGTRASDVSAAAEAAFKQHGLPMAHYTGHQIGVTVNELPRLVPYDHTPIQPGMVFSVEPGAYEGPGGTFGARSEKIVLVTASGPEILSTFQWGI